MNDVKKANNECTFLRATIVLSLFYTFHFRRLSYYIPYSSTLKRLDITSFQNLREHKHRTHGTENVYHRQSPRIPLPSQRRAGGEEWTRRSLQVRTRQDSGRP